MKRDVQIRRMERYLEYGLLKAKQEIDEHKFDLLSGFFFSEHPKTGEPFRCGTIGCALGSFALSAAGRRAGWKIRNHYDGTPTEPYYSKANPGEWWDSPPRSMCEYLGLIDREHGVLMLGMSGHRRNTDGQEHGDHHEIRRMIRIMRNWIKNLKADRDYWIQANGSTVDEESFR